MAQRGVFLVQTSKFQQLWLLQREIAEALVEQIPAGSNEVVFCPTTLGRSCARASIQGTEGCYTTAQD